MKPQLPKEIAASLPLVIVQYIQTFVPHLPKPKHSPHLSPIIERDLKRIQNMHLKGSSGMYLRDFDDFVLD